MRLVQGRERDEPLERLERLGLDPHRSRVLQTPVDDPVADADQSVVRELALQEVSEILNRAIVTELPSGPRLLGHDAARRILRHEARCRVEGLDLSPYLERELAGALSEHGELDARRAGVQNEDRVVGSAHCCCSVASRHGWMLEFDGACWARARASSTGHREGQELPY